MGTHVNAGNQHVCATVTWKSEGTALSTVPQKPPGSCFFETRFLTGLKLAECAELTGQEPSRSLPQCWGYNEEATKSRCSYVGLGDQTCAGSKHSTN